MINNRNKSVVTDMKWTSDGERICIIYQDGAVIVGGVGGDRISGLELHTALQQCEWAPNGKNILFGTGAGDVLIYDNLVRRKSSRRRWSAAGPGLGAALQSTVPLMAAFLPNV